MKSELLKKLRIIMAVLLLIVVLSLAAILTLTKTDPSSNFYTAGTGLLIVFVSSYALEWCLIFMYRGLEKEMKSVNDEINQGTKRVKK